MTEVKHEVKSVKNQGEVIVDNDRAAPRERNPELDQLGCLHKVCLKKLGLVSFGSRHPLLAFGVPVHNE